MPFRIIRDDLTRVRADAIVNTANPLPAIGWGTDSAVYRAAGEKQLLAERRKIGRIAPGQAACTGAFRLKAKYIIHTVGPVWEGGNNGEADTLYHCYENSLKLAADLSCESIAFPLISTGTYGFPRELALNTAMSAIGQYLLTSEMDVTLVVFDRQSVALSSALVEDVREYIDEYGVAKARQDEYPDGEIRDLRARLGKSGHSANAAPSFGSAPAFPHEDKCMAMDEVELCAPAPEPRASAAVRPSLNRPAGGMDDLDRLLKTKEDTFQQRLFRLIDESGMDDITVYKKANIDRKLFSAIKCKPDYKPSKKTAVAFAIALELDMHDLKDLLSRAGFAISPASKFDLIISYFVTHRVYDIMKINSVLFDYDQPLLGA